MSKYLPKLRRIYRCLFMGPREREVVQQLTPVERRNYSYRGFAQDMFTTLLILGSMWIASGVFAMTEGDLGITLIPALLGVLSVSGTVLYQKQDLKFFLSKSQWAQEHDIHLSYIESLVSLDIKTRNDLNVP